MRYENVFFFLNFPRGLVGASLLEVDVNWMKETKSSLSKPIYIIVQPTRSFRLSSPVRKENFLTVSNET